MILTSRSHTIEKLENIIRHSFSTQGANDWVDFWNSELFEFSHEDRYHLTGFDSTGAVLVNGRWVVC
jgi:hypothetical protein